MTEQLTIPETEIETSLYGFETRPNVDNRRTERNGMYDIKQLWQRSHEIIGLALIGHKNVDIAKTLGITESCVSNTLNGPLGSEKLGEMRGERDEGFKKVADRITELTQKAMQVYEDIFDSDTASLDLKRKAADTVTLELAGHRAPTKIDSRNINLTATPAELEEFKSRGQKAMLESGIIDITPRIETNESEEATE